MHNTDVENLVNAVEGILMDMVNCRSTSFYGLAQLRIAVEPFKNDDHDWWDEAGIISLEKAKEIVEECDGSYKQ